MEIQANVTAAPGIEVDHVRWWTEGEGGHFEGDMSFNETGDGLWKAVWESWHGPNGWYNIRVRAEGVQEGVPGGPSFFDEYSVNVYVDNGKIPVSAWVLNYTDGLEKYQVEVEIGVSWLGKEMETKSTPFEFDRQRDSGLSAPGEWNGIPFWRWIIWDEGEGKVWGTGDPNIGIDDWLLEMVYGRELQCIYSETPPQPPE